MRSFLRAAGLARLLGLGGRGFTGLWMAMAVLGLLRRLAATEEQRLIKRRLRTGDRLLVRVVRPGTEPPPEARRLRSSG